MCELFGMTSKHSRKVNDFLEVFFSHSLEHKNGWGLALLDGIPPVIEKEPVKAIDSTFLKKRLKNEIRTSRCIAHIRLATIGEMNVNNTHPFIRYDSSGRMWVLAHNGTIFESEILTSYQYRQEGSTDSERILLCLVDRMNRLIREGIVPDADRRISIIEDMIRNITPGNKVNLMIFDGELLYVHKNEPGTMYVREKANTVFFSTRPLETSGWKEAAQNTLLVCKEGQRIYTGRQHNNTYIHDESKMKPLYLAYSGL